MQVISDRKLPNGDGTDITYYEAEVISYSDYYPFGMLMPNRHGQDDDYRYGFNGMEKDDEVRGTKGASYDFGARMLDPRIGRWLSLDPFAHEYPSQSDYIYVSSNPILNIDPNGKWDIEVHAYKDREKYGYGIAILKDKDGNEVFRFKVRLEGTGGRDRSVKNSDTPLGTYDIPEGKGTWLSGGSRKSYGPNHRLVLTPKSGEIKESDRDLIRIHGGRQEKYDKKTKTWKEVDNPELKKTHGCLRAFDSDMILLKQKTDELEANDKEEKAGDLTITDDLVKKKNKYYAPTDLKKEDKGADSKYEVFTTGSGSKVSVPRSLTNLFRVFGKVTKMTKGITNAITSPVRKGKNILDDAGITDSEDSNETNDEVYDSNEDPDK